MRDIENVMRLMAVDGGGWSITKVNLAIEELVYRIRKILAELQHGRVIYKGLGVIKMFS